MIPLLVVSPEAAERASSSRVRSYRAPGRTRA